MTSSRVLIALLVAATVLVDWVVMVCLGGPPLPATSTPSFTASLLMVALIALVLSQVNLLATWVGLRRQASPWPWTCLVGFVVLYNLLAIGDTGNTTGLTLSLLIQAGFVIGSLWIARLAGVILVKDEGDAVSQTAAENKKPFQFSLAQLFGWMIGLAVCLGLLRCAIDYAHLLALLRFEYILGLFLPFTINVVIVFLVLWIAMSSRWPAVRGAVLCVVTIAAIAFMWMSAFVHPSWWLPAMLGLNVLLMLESLLVVRMAGYRLTVRKKTSAHSGVEIVDERDATEAPDGNA